MGGVTKDKCHLAELASMSETGGRGWYLGIRRVCVDTLRKLSIVMVKRGGLEAVNDDDVTSVGLFSPGVEHFQPKQIVKSLIPSWNTLVFFEVSPVSFHQVKIVSHKYREY